MASDPKRIIQSTGTYLSCASSFQYQNDRDIFMELEMQISMFSSKGKVIVLRDFNVRTSDQNGFIKDDIIQSDILREVYDTLTYETDTVLPKRVNPDKTVNEYGRKLLPLRFGLRILNIRHIHKRDDTVMVARGRVRLMIVYQHPVYSTLLKILLLLLTSQTSLTMLHYIFN